MKLKTAASRKPGSFRLTQSGWLFLLDLLTVAGYGPRGEKGRVVVRGRLRKDFYAAIKPGSPSFNSLSLVARKARERAYVAIGVRLQRLRPGNPARGVSETTLRALSQLSGFADPHLWRDPSAQSLLRQVSRENQRAIDFQMFCKRLTDAASNGVSSSQVGKADKEFANAGPANAVAACSPGTARIGYFNAVSFSMIFHFCNLQLVPEHRGLRFVYVPIGTESVPADPADFLNILLPLEAVGGLLVTALAFLDQVISYDENIILWNEQKSNVGAGSDSLQTVVKLYRDAPRGESGQLTGSETCWIRITTGSNAERTRRIPLWPRGLLSLIDACRLTAMLAATRGDHAPRPCE